MHLCCSIVCVHKLVKFVKNSTRSWLFPSSNRDWSELRLELLELIWQRLPLEDMVHAKLVCSSWNAAVKSYISSPVTYKPLVPQSPWLMIPSGVNDKDDGIFYSLSEQKVYIIRNLFQGVEYGCNAHVMGSSYGWLFIGDSHLVESGVTVYLFNPITRARIRLPPLKFHPKLISSCYLSSDPSCNNIFYVVLRYDSEEDHTARTTFYKHSDDDGATWTYLDEGFGSIFFRNNILCGLSLVWESTLLLRAFDLETNTPIHMDLQPPQKNDPRSVYGIPYMVESQGDILFVQASWILTERKSYCYEIHKLNFDGGSNKVECVKVECLQDRCCVILSKDLFGTNPSVLLSTLDFPKLEPNSIYVVRYLLKQVRPSHDKLVWEIRAYSLENKGVFKTVFKSQKYERIPRYWIVPSPCMLYNLE